MMRTCARIVHRSFRRVESCAEWLTGAAGPVFVVLCTILVSIGGWTFFTTSFTKLAPLPEAIDELLGTANPVHFLLGLPAALAHQPLDTLRYVGVLASCAYIMLSIVVHYTLAIRESPGSVLTGLGPTRKERRTGPGSYMWWLERRRRAARASRGGGSGDDTRSVREMGLIDASDSVVDEACESEDLWAHVKMCHKCPKVPLVVALAALPPELRAVERQRRVQAQTSDGKGAKSAKRAMRATEAAEALPLAARGESEEDIRAWLGRDADKLVSPPKPERTHHCSVCQVCVLKFDHHCPWLNQCVGLGNERHFVLFMSWLAFGMFIVVASSWSIVQQSISFREHWQYTYTPRLFPLLTFTLCAIMGLALSVMAIWQLAIVAWGETSVENSDNSHYRELAKRKSHSFTNVYDVGRWRNIQLFFNIGPNSGHSVFTLLAPWRIQPYSDGWHWAKQRGLMGRHAGIEAEEELTDDEVERPDAHPMASVTH